MFVVSHKSISGRVLPFLCVLFFYQYSIFSNLITIRITIDVLLFCVFEHANHISSAFDFKFK